MTSERLEQVERLFHAALELPLPQRSAFVEKACDGDQTLLAELQSLLASHEQAEEFIAASALEVAAKTFGNEAACLLGERIGQYEVLSLLGTGGMGEVYLAQDTQLDRKVAIKFLQPHSIGDAGAKRWLIREARSAAGLDHPNICAIHQVFDDEKHSFIVMQYIEGETLARRIARKPLPAESALDIAEQVAGALAEAHAHGIVHRDIKPQNIMLTPQDRVKVLDFGLARSIVEAKKPSSGMVMRDSLTEDGVIAGTVSYMSPEQLRGETLDARTDIFSLGVVMYEMLTGRQAFNAGTRAETIAAILTQELQDTRRFTDTPEALVSIIHKAVHKKRKERYASAEELLNDLRTLGPRPSSSVVGATSWSTSRIRRMGLPVALIFLIAIIPFLTAMGWWWLHPKSAAIPIAVLPLRSLSQDPANDYFSDGLTDELIRNLSIIDGLEVRSHTSSFAFKGSARDLREVGKELRADYILEGSILRVDPELRINTRLVRVRDDVPVWSGRYDENLTDVFAIQDEISRGITNELRLTLGRGRRRYETSVEAYDLYLRARTVPNGFGANLQIIGLFEQAIAKDPSFAPAYAGLATARAFESGLPYSDRTDELAKMLNAARKAIELDPLLAEAHDALGTAYARDGQWEHSEQSFRRALELDRNRSLSYEDFVLYLLLPLGRIEEALRQLWTAEKNDPLSPDVQDYLAFVLLSAGRYDEAATHCEKEPVGYRYKSECLGRARLAQRRTNEAIQILATSDRPLVRAYLGNAYARAGRRDEAEKLAASLAPNPFQEALIYAGLGDKDRTLEALERMTALGPARVGGALNSPELAFLRGDPRVKAIRKKVGLPE
jgi:serine/threonine protein kinase/tetratricopeptide (TPR) repeat protein